MLTFQELVLQLSSFWAKKGCIIHMGHDLETGAGTFNPATFLRCLGPEPYKTAYVEPSRRPADGRFAENPNRIQLFHQFQVILKPSPANIQQLYLESLDKIGLDLKQHDIRFVHDDWESPTLGAWGLGWEVWCDGMEVSQFTYFQAMASLSLAPISGEITYGLERLCMFIQNVDNIFDIRWNDQLTLGDISRSNEIEWSTYNFKSSSAEMWLKHFADFENEAKRLLAQQLPLPAYDFVIKASHAFNMLDARGVISTTERTGYIARIRDLARLAAQGYIASREKLGFPLLKYQKSAKIPRAKKNALAFTVDQKRDFLLEIGSEQLPAAFVPIGMRNLETAISGLLTEHNLSYDSLKSFATPRRLAIYVHGLIEGKAARLLEKKGPPLSVAFDANDQWTEQGLGFLKTAHIKTARLETIRAGKHPNLFIRSLQNIEYLFVRFEEKARSTAEILAAKLPQLIANIDFPKKMRWGALDVTYARPIHWIVSLFGSEVISFVFGDIATDRITYGHAQMAPHQITISSTEEWLPKLHKNHVIADVAQRKEMILSQLETLRCQISDTASIPEKDKVIAEVLHLTECPHLISASFDALFLNAPAPLLISEMVEHQRYFPIECSGQLCNQFIITCDKEPNDLIIRGNQKVLSARLSDGLFLYEQDCKISLEHMALKLRDVVFQQDLGSLYQKSAYIATCAVIWNRILREIADPAQVLRAAALCKADLVSNCVKEFPQLQGIIGKSLALVHGEPPEVAAAIEEHWLPKSERGALPETPLGIVLSLADKTDNLISYYSVGLKPTASSDPYALRRQTIGLIKILLHNKFSVNLKSLLEECCSHRAPACAHQIPEILRFLTTRAKGIFEELSFSKDEIEAALAVSGNECLDPYDTYCQLQELHKFRQTQEFANLIEVYKRVKGLIAAAGTKIFDRTLGKHETEIQLANTLDALAKQWPSVLEAKHYARAYSLLATLQQPLADLLSNVKILDDDMQIRENRLALLQTLFSYFGNLLDLGMIKSSQPTKTKFNSA